MSWYVQLETVYERDLGQKLSHKLLDIIRSRKQITRSELQFPRLEERPKIIALDLEGTIISNAMSQFSRPGLYPFMEFCLSHFEHVVIFTAVNESRAVSIVEYILEENEIPNGDYPYVKWKGEWKDLKWVQAVYPTYSIDEMVLVDDLIEYVKPSQFGQWIEIENWKSPYDGNDEELYRIMDKMTEWFL